MMDSGFWVIRVPDFYETVFIVGHVYFFRVIRKSVPFFLTNKIPHVNGFGFKNGNRFSVSVCWSGGGYSIFLRQGRFVIVMPFIFLGGMKKWFRR